MAAKARVLLLGDSFVGKTTLSNYISKGEFNPYSKPTTAVGFILVHFDDTLDIQLWDTAGMERYRSLNKVYFREASGALLIFDFSSKTSFENISKWRDDFLAGDILDDAVLFLVGNKYDCVTGNVKTQEENPNPNQKSNLVQEVDEEEAVKYANDNKMQYFAVSSLTGEGISELVQAIGNSVPRKIADSYNEPIVNTEPKKKCC